jgi:primosomal protein N' (replication factor Y) (superfamily II helicase)
MSPRFADVALPVPLRRTFTYRVPDALTLAPGVRVAVPFSGQKLAGFVLRTHGDEPTELKRVREVAGCFEPEPIFPEELLRFLLRAADYYIAPLGEVLKSAAPALPKEALEELKASGFVARTSELKGRHIATKKTLRVRRLFDVEAPPRLGAQQRVLLALLDARGEVLLGELAQHTKGARALVNKLAARGLVEIEEVNVASDPFYAEELPREQPFTPNAEQQHAIDTLTAALEKGAPGAYLLHGVTGSGKTEVYLQVVARALERGGGALVLVPEIALTPQLVARFRARFGEGIAVLHSGLSDRERHRAWLALRAGELRLAVGARSALFAPVPNLSVLIVDEEHDSSFKQEEGFRYHGRDMALLRAHMTSALCVLGSATPSIESYYLVEQGRMHKLSLVERAQRQLMPEVELIDLARHRGPGPSGHPLLTGPMHRALEHCLAEGDQAILFLNRRGFAPSLACAACTEVVRCPACSVSLTEHRRAGLLRCHYCDFATPLTEACPSCGALALTRVGIGTERIEEALLQSFPHARVGRLDRDTAAGRGVEEVLDRMRSRSLDVLVGTQMVTKGHDLPGVTLVGVLLADQSLSFPDFRAAERTFQLLAQVAGRAGRGARPGRVLLQTYQPDHYAVRYAIRHDYGGFYRQEIAARRELAYAPLVRLAAVRVDAGDEQAARAAIGELADVATRCAEVQAREVMLLGPAPAPIERIRGRHRMRFLLRARSRDKLRNVASRIVARIDQGLAPARAHLDIDPVSML